MATLDPITLEVMRGRFETIANEMERTLLRTAHSTMINQALDATAAIFDRNGRTVAQAQALPCHLGQLTTVMDEVVKVFPPGKAAPGDAYILNDPYSGGTHLPDFAVIVPICIADETIGYAATMAHHTDVGGVAPGSTATNAIDIHAEGIRVPLLRLAVDGQLDEQLVTLLVHNSRNHEVLRGDLEGQLAACHTGVRRFRETCDEWGAATTLMASDQLMAYAEARTRAVIAGVPDGVYRFADYMDDDGVGPGPIPITVAVTVEGSQITFDFTGTSPQVAGGINCTVSSTLASIYYIVRVLGDATIPTNDGCFRPISVVLPPRSIVNCGYPAPVGARSCTFKRIVDVLAGALAEAVPDKINAASSGQSNLLYVGGGGLATVEPIAVPFPGGMGARPTKDGIDVVEADLTNAYNVPIELLEARVPLLVNALQLWTDSGGAGRYRGGLGYEATVAWEGGDAWVTTRRDRHKFRPWGLAGGGSAPSCRFLLTRASGEQSEVASKSVFRISSGDVLQMWTSGGGGYGDAWSRPIEAVVSDVFDGRVSIDCAREDYGVVIADGEVDVPATERLRSIERV